MRWRMQHGVLIKWRGILRPELNATLHHPLRRGSSYKLLPIVAPHGYVNDTSRLPECVIAEFDIRHHSIDLPASCTTFVFRATNPFITIFIISTLNGGAPWNPLNHASSIHLERWIYTSIWYVRWDYPIRKLIFYSILSIGKRERKDFDARKDTPVITFLCANCRRTAGCAYRRKTIFSIENHAL